jgi:hypothetical protein
MLSQVSATNKQRITLYILTLLFIWVNGIAAPYQVIQNATSKSEICLLVSETPQSSLKEIYSTSGETSLQLPADDEALNLHSAYPAEETFEEQEEVEHRRDEDGIRYVLLPDYLTIPFIAENNSLLHLSHHNLFSAVRKQSTYLLDCTFLI